MPRIAGVDIPADKPIWVSLGYIYGVGPTNSRVNLPAAMRQYLPTRPEEVAQLVSLDWITVNRNRQAWTDRFNRELGR